MHTSVKFKGHAKIVACGLGYQLSIVKKRRACFHQSIKDSIVNFKKIPQLLSNSRDNFIFNKVLRTFTLYAYATEQNKL